MAGAHGARRKPSSRCSLHDERLRDGPLPSCVASGGVWEGRHFTPGSPWGTKEGLLEEAAAQRQ